MKYFTNFLFVFLFVNVSFSQNNYEYVGAIKLNDSSLITYQIKFVEKNGEIKGYSLTDVGGLHETKSNLYGKYNAIEKFIEFKEKDIVYTKSPIVQEDFCFVNFKSSKFKLGNSKITGKFKGLFSDNTQCINGDILLSTKEKMEKRIAKVQKIISKTKKIPDSLKERSNIVKIMDSVNMNILRDKQVLSVFSKSKNIRIEIFDGGKLDGDKVTLKYNGNTLLRNFETKKDRKSIPLTLVNKKNTFILTADNVGSMSTNTAVIEIFVDNSKIKALTNLNKGEQTQIDFYLKD
ncbi:hypothetical protein [Lacinutrix sp. Bg11-31]|uniref:hypothetical protein n=1 Tax=Lacinutrix sp. Bg11-31 TaxID=2057808 RepID=UPI000C317443|nr:hypothetical protein [Lacinutrix sp. Bg11-31]AUC81658.1 hypothetical protein CW733_05740 [Lacinutrix sp. Bg11-31]